MPSPPRAFSDPYEADLVSLYGDDGPSMTGRQFAEKGRSFQPRPLLSVPVERRDLRFEELYDCPGDDGKRLKLRSIFVRQSDPPAVVRTLQFVSVDELQRSRKIDFTPRADAFIAETPTKEKSPRPSRQAARIVVNLDDEDEETSPPKKRARINRKRNEVVLDHDSNPDEQKVDLPTKKSAGNGKRKLVISDDEEDEEEEAESSSRHPDLDSSEPKKPLSIKTPVREPLGALSSNVPVGQQKTESRRSGLRALKPAKPAATGLDFLDDGADIEEPAPSPKPKRKRGFVVDDDDFEVDDTLRALGYGPGLKRKPGENYDFRFPGGQPSISQHFADDAASEYGDDKQLQIDAEAADGPRCDESCANGGCDHHAVDDDWQFDGDSDDDDDEGIHEDCPFVDFEEDDLAELGRGADDDELEQSSDDSSAEDDAASESDTAAKSGRQHRHTVRRTPQRQRVLTERKSARTTKRDPKAADNWYYDIANFEYLDVGKAKAPASFREIEDAEVESATARLRDALVRSLEVRCKQAETTPWDHVHPKRILHPDVMKMLATYTPLELAEIFISGLCRYRRWLYGQAAMQGRRLTAEEHASIPAPSRDMLHNKAVYEDVISIGPDEYRYTGSGTSQTGGSRMGNYESLLKKKAAGDIVETSDTLKHPHVLVRAGAKPVLRIIACFDDTVSTELVLFFEGLLVDFNRSLSDWEASKDFTLYTHECLVASQAAFPFEEIPTYKVLNRTHPYKQRLSEKIGRVISEDLVDTVIWRWRLSEELGWVLSRPGIVCRPCLRAWFAYDVAMRPDPESFREARGEKPSVYTVKGKNANGRAGKGFKDAFKNFLAANHVIDFHGLKRMLRCSTCVWSWPRRKGMYASDAEVDTWVASRRVMNEKERHMATMIAQDYKCIFCPNVAPRHGTPEYAAWDSSMFMNRPIPPQTAEEDGCYYCKGCESNWKGFAARKESDESPITKRDIADWRHGRLTPRENPRILADKKTTALADQDWECCFCPNECPDDTEDDHKKIARGWHSTAIPPQKVNHTEAL
nr:hypothetical protein B0A51_08333 [Rachicladosporium sp. CCFEE 5018]